MALLDDGDADRLRQVTLARAGPTEKQAVRPLGDEATRGELEDLRRSGQTILMFEQNAAKALEISDYAYVLELGVNRFDGSEAIRNDDRIRRLYLGR
jgi:ABC-type branched-subunit amino acid transport system ATPase component